MDGRALSLLELLCSAGPGFGVGNGFVLGGDFVGGGSFAAGTFCCLHCPITGIVKTAGVLMSFGMSFGGDFIGGGSCAFGGPTGGGALLT